MVDPDTEDSVITNPYAPPARDESPSSAVKLGPNEAFRVVDKKLYCRRGLERFPNICWLTGSTDGLIGVHSKKGRYLPKRAGQLYAIAYFLWAAAMMELNLPLTVWAASFIPMVVGDSVMRRMFGKSFEFVVGETQISRNYRSSCRRFGFWACGIAIGIAGANLYFVYWLHSAFIFFVPVTIVVLGIGYLIKRPRFFSATVGEHSDGTLVIQGLTKEFLEAVQRMDRY